MEVHPETRCLDLVSSRLGEMEPPAVAGVVHLEVHQEDLETISRLTGEFSFDHSPKPMTRVQGKLRSGIRNPLSTLNEPSQECLYRERFIWNGTDDIRSMTAGGGPLYTARLILTGWSASTLNPQRRSNHEGALHDNFHSLSVANPLPRTWFRG